jgi:Mg2+/citrate symporter
MTLARLALIATAAAGLTVIVAPASASQIVMGQDGHYYRLVPVRGPAAGEAGISRQATANVAPAPVSNCRLINFEDNEYEPEYTTVCGPE